LSSGGEGEGREKGKKVPKENPRHLGEERLLHQREERKGECERNNSKQRRGNETEKFALLAREREKTIRKK